MNEIPQQGPSLTPEQRALVALRRMRSRLEQLEQAQTEPIAIIGMGLRFPGNIDRPEAFWRLLHEGKDAITTLPDQRWNIDEYYQQDPQLPEWLHTHWGGFLRDVDLFDASFFGISQREAKHMDPQQRLLLEVVWEALENAGLPPHTLARSQTGVFVGVGNGDYYCLQASEASPIDPYIATGSSYSVLAGRISYQLDLRGPSISLDTACSSSLVAIHMACHSLRSKECNLALVGGVNLLLSPLPSIAFAKWGMLATDGRCKTFDAQADGFVRGEGCGVVVLKRLSEAVADNDTILALVRGSAISQDGHSNGLTAPNMLAQQAVIRQALTNASLTADHISYVEAHGTGTALGDPIELEALTATIGQPRTNGTSCMIGSVKTNLGHLEAAAGMAGLLKVILALQHNEIPPNLNFTQLNPNITLANTPFVIPTTPQPWLAGDTPRYAGISAFGFSGTNAHIIVSEAPLRTTAPVHLPAEATGRMHILPLSGHTPAALQAQAQIYQHFLSATTDTLASICFTASTRRSHHKHRLLVSGQTSQEIIESLKTFLTRRESQRDISEVGQPGSHPKMAFIFPGQSSQWARMGCDLLQREPVFREMMQQCETLFQRHVSWSLLEILQADHDHTRLQETAIAQPVLFAIEIALAALWNSWGIKPDAVIGHSVGEVAAAYVAGALTLEEAIHLVFRRGNVMQQTHGQGGMLIVGLPAAQAQPLLAVYQGQASIAAVNSPQTVVIAGPLPLLDDLQARLQRSGIFHRLLEMPYAFHSEQMNPCQQAFLTTCQSLHPRPAVIPIISTVTGQAIQGEELTVAYWGRNLREPVLFAQALELLIRDNYEIFLEVGPHPVMATAIAQALEALARTGTTLSSMRKNHNEQKLLFQSLGHLYSRGFPLGWQAFYPVDEPRCNLPNYSWQQDHFWLDTTRNQATNRVITRHSSVTSGDHPLLGPPYNPALHKEDHCWQTVVQTQLHPYLREHRVQEVMLMPATAYVEMLLAASSQLFHKPTTIVENMRFKQALVLRENEPTTIQVVLSEQSPETALFHCFSQSGTSGEAKHSGWTLHATATLQLKQTQEDHPALPLQDMLANASEHITGDEHYQFMQQGGLNYGPAFRGVQELWREDEGIIAHIRLPETLVEEAVRYQFHPALLDACLQIVAHVLPLSLGNASYVPVSIDRIVSYERITSDVWVYAHAQNDAFQSEDPLKGNVVLQDASGKVLMAVQGLQLQLLEQEQPEHIPDEWFYHLTWEELAPILMKQASPADQSAGGWLIFADKQGLTDHLQTLLNRQHIPYKIVRPGESFQKTQDQHYQIDYTQVADFSRLFDDVYNSEHPFYQHILYLWGLDLHLPTAASQQHIKEAIELCCGSIIHLVQALCRLDEHPPLQLWLITAGVQTMQMPPPHPLNIFQAPVWGLGRVIANEHPELHCRCLDLNPVPAYADATVLLDEILLAAQEDQLAVRDGKRYAARLQHTQPPTTTLDLHPDGTYLITGGLGGIGLTIAQWLIQQGCHHLVLTGRQGATGPAQATVEAWGTDVVVCSADVTQFDEMQAVFTMIQKKMPPLRGIIHTAAVLDDGMLEMIEPTQFWRVLAPKVIGAWNLHTLAARLPLDFFVLFSSAASFLGTPGQSNYVAANAFLDTLSLARCYEGYPSLTIDWGSWSQVGMVARAGHNAQLVAYGLSSITPTQGLTVLARLLSGTAGQIAVLPFDLQKWCQSFPQAATSSLLQQLIPEHPPTDARAQIMLWEQLQAAPPEQYSFLIKEFTYKQIAQILQIPVSQLDDATILNDLGIDSLIGLELRGQLEQHMNFSLPTTMIWEYPTISALVGFLSQKFSLLSQQEIIVHQ